jgi:hypothetical protein
MGYRSSVEDWMKGIVYNLLEEIVAEEYGEAVWDRLLATAGVEGAYTSLGSYPDAQLFAIIDAASRTLQIESRDLIRWFGKRALPRLAQTNPRWFESHRTARDLILTLNDIIHPEVRKLYPGADVPWFDFETPSSNRLVLGYRSKRKLCAFAEGLIDGTAAHYGETVTIAQSTCMLEGADRCVLDCTFTKRASA